MAEWVKRVASEALQRTLATITSGLGALLLADAWAEARRDSEALDAVTASKSDLCRSNLSRGD
jgi:hypothetical protein